MDYTTLHNDYDIIIHIGAPKTGSSAIQKFLLSNRHKLQQFGFYYPNHGLDPNGISGGHSNIGLKLINGEIKEAKEILDKYTLQAKQKNLLLLLSAESFFNYPTELKLLTNKKRVKILSFVREPFSSLLSHYNQGIKRHFQTNDINSYINNIFMQKGNSDLLDITLKDWEKEFKVNNIEILKYDKSFFIKKTIQEVFLKAIGIKQKNINQIKPKKINVVNRSYNLNELEFKRLINSVLNRNNTEMNNQLDYFLQKNSDKEEKLESILNEINEDISNKISSKFKVILPKKKNTYYIKKLKNILNIIELLKEEEIKIYNYIQQCIISYLECNIHTPYNIYNLATWFDIPIDSYLKSNTIGYIDYIDNDYIKGWVKYRDSEEPIEVELFIDEKIIRATKANTYRKDLKSKRIHSTGKCGFIFKLNSLKITSDKKINVRIKDNITLLKKTKNCYK